MSKTANEQNSRTNKVVNIIGAGLAGCEAAWQLASRGIKVCLFEMRPAKLTPIHKTGDFAELVCSNSLKSAELSSAAGTLKYELTHLGSKLLQLALQNRTPAGKALAIDRSVFSQIVTKAIKKHQNIEFINAEVTDIDQLFIQSKDPDKDCTANKDAATVSKDTAQAAYTIIATGPLTSPALAAQIQELVGQKSLAFYDAAAPIVEAETLDKAKLFEQSRYMTDSSDYLNAALNKEQYESFVQELKVAKRTILKDFETKDLFMACQPIEEVAKTGIDTLRHGALKPVGLSDPTSGMRPWAVVQLRAENRTKSAYNLVGFQTNLTFSEQERVFRMIPGLENAEFMRFGVMHHNIFINSTQTLDKSFALETSPNLHFAGQITGTEGYVEAIASGLYVALCVYAKINDLQVPVLPKHSVLGALFDYATDTGVLNYQPMHVNYGIVEPLQQKIRGKKLRYQAYSKRAQIAIEDFKRANPELALPTCVDTTFLLV